MINKKDTNKKSKQTREAQMAGERNIIEKKKSFYDSADIIREVLKQSGKEANEANLKNVRRIIELMRKITGRDILKEKDKDVFNKIVGITKRIFDDNGNNLKKILSNSYRGNKSLTVEEYDILINAFVEEQKKGMNVIEQKELEERIKSLKGDDLIEAAERLKKFYNEEYFKIVDKLLEIENPNTRMVIFNTYQEFLQTSLIKFNKKIDLQIKFEKALKSLLEKEPELIDSEEIKTGKLSKELETKIAIEMNLENIIKDAKEYFNNK